MCNHGMTACSDVGDMARMLGLERVPTSKWPTGMIRGTDPDGIEATCQRFLHRTVRMATRDRLMQGKGGSARPHPHYGSLRARGRKGDVLTPEMSDKLLLMLANLGLPVAYLTDPPELVLKRWKK